MCSSRQRTFERCSSSDNWETLRKGERMGEDWRRRGGERKGGTMKVV